MWSWGRKEKLEAEEYHHRQFVAGNEIDEVLQELFAINKAFLLKNPYLRSPAHVYPTCEEDIESQPLIPMPDDDIWQMNRGDWL